MTPEQAIHTIRRMCEETMWRKRSTQAWANTLADVHRIANECITASDTCPEPIQLESDTVRRYW